MANIILPQDFVDSCDGDWTIRTCETAPNNNKEESVWIEFEAWSPAGEDLPLDLYFDGTCQSLIKSLQEYCDTFDVDEHVELWIGSRGQRGVPGTVSELLEDAKAIDKMQKDLLKSIQDYYKSKLLEDSIGAIRLDLEIEPERGL